MRHRFQAEIPRLGKPQLTYQCEGAGGFRAGKSLIGVTVLLDDEPRLKLNAKPSATAAQQIAAITHRGTDALLLIGVWLGRTTCDGSN